MSVYPFCGQCKRKTPEKTVIFNSYCDCCKETLCIDCSENHTSVKGFSCHKLIASAILLSPSNESICHCKVHSDKLLTWYCPSYGVYLCEECEKTAKWYGSTCNRHIHVCFNENPNIRVLIEIKSQLEGEMTKMNNILDLCYKSRRTNEEELNKQMSDEFSSETTSANDEKDRKVFEERLENIKLERKGIEILLQYCRKCQDELKKFIRICPAIGMLSLIMKISNLKQDILKLYSSLKKNTILFEDRLKIKCTSICEAGKLIIKSFRIESKICLRAEDVRKVVLIGSDVIVFTPYKIQRYNSRNKLENEIMFQSTDSAYISKLDRLAIMADGYAQFAIYLLNIDTFVFDDHPLKLQKQPFQQPLKVIAASSDYIYFAGQNTIGRLALNEKYSCVIFNGEVGNEMIINNNEIIIPFGQYIRCFSLNFDLLRFLSVSGESIVQINEFDAQQPLPNVVYNSNYQEPYQQDIPRNNQQPFNSNPSQTPIQSTLAANFISITTDQDNNVYAVNTNSQDIKRWKHLNKTWEAIITPCHGLRNPSYLEFDEEFSNAYICAKDFHPFENCLLKYKVIWDTI